VLASRRLLLAFGATLVVASGCARVPADVQTIHEASRFLGTASSLPAANAPGWETVPLPDYWDGDMRRRAVEGWYRVTLELAAAPTELWAVYLPRVGQTAGVWVNGVHLGGGDAVDPLPRDWVNPLFFTVPTEILRSGTNEVAVRVLTHVGAPGYLRDVEIGPERSLRRVFDRVLWWQLGLTQVIAATTLVTGLLILFVAWGRPELRDSIWLAIGLVVWSW